MVNPYTCHHHVCIGNAQGHDSQTGIKMVRQAPQLSGWHRDSRTAGRLNARGGRLCDGAILVVRQRGSRALVAGDVQALA